MILSKEMVHPLKEIRCPIHSQELNLDLEKDVRCPSCGNYHPISRDYIMLHCGWYSEDHWILGQTHNRWYKNGFEIPNEEVQRIINESKNNL